MQILKPLFSDENYIDSFCNVQKCLRLNDLDEVGDYTHYLSFHMLGLFSFRQLTVPQVIGFWLDFLSDYGLYPTHVTIHPDKFEEWKDYYPSNVEIRKDSDCVWSDGNIGGYCTEFYYNEVEIGNIVNPLGTCIDVGLGIERILNLKHGSEIIPKGEIIKHTVEQLLSEGFVPGNSKQNYILRKLMIILVFSESFINNTHYWNIYNGQINIYKNYLKVKGKKSYSNKTPGWWLDTFGIDISQLEKYKILLDKKH